MIPMTANSPRPGRPTGRCWWLPTCSKKGSKGWADQPQEWGRATTSTPIAGATREGDCEDDIRGTLRLWLVGIARGTQGGGKSSLLVPAPPGHGSMSPFRTQSHHPEKALQWGSMWAQSPNRRKVEECDLGPPLTLQPKLEQFLGGYPAVMEGGAICLKSPLWRTMKSGWSGEATSSTHQTGGKSWWPSLMSMTTADSPRRYEPLLRFLGEVQGPKSH